MGGIFSSGRKDQFGEALIVSQKLRNAAWMLSSIPDLRTAFIQYLKDKRWVALYLERIHCGCAEMDDSVSMAVRYNFPAELLELFPTAAESSHDNVSVADTALPSFPVDPINSHQQDTAHQSGGNKASLPATGNSTSSKEAAPDNGATTSPTLHRDCSIHPSLVSLQSTMFVSTSSLLANSAQCNMTNIQSSIQQELKLVVIAGILLIYVDSTEYKQWIRNHMSLVTFTEICQQELEQSLRSLRNFRPPSLSLTGNNNHRSVRRKVHPQNRANSPPTNRKNALQKELAKRAKLKQEAAEQQVDVAADTNPASSSSVASESPEKLLFQQQQQLRNRRRQEHNERLKKVIFAALSIPFAGGHTLRHVLSTSDWLTQLVHFIHYLPVGVNVASTSALLYHYQMTHHHSHLSGCCGMCCTPPREDCPVLYVNRHQEIMTEMPEDAMLGHSIGHMLANHYLVHVATHCHQPRSSSGEHNVASTHTTTSKTVSSEVPSLRIDDSVHLKQNGSVGRRSTVAGSPFSHLIDDVGSIPLSDDEKQLLRRIKDLEMQVLKRQQAAYLTYRIPHYDGHMYWHFIKCLPMYHKLCDLVDDEYIYPLQSESSKERLQAQRGSTKAEENPRPKDPSPRHRYGVNELACFDDDVYENAWDLTQRTVDGGLLHVVTSHTVLRDVKSAHSRADSAVLGQASDGKSAEPFDSSLSSPKPQQVPPRESSTGSLPPASVSRSHSHGNGPPHHLGTALAVDRGDERLYTQSDMQNLAMDLQAVDDLLLILSVLF